MSRKFLPKTGKEKDMLSRRIRTFFFQYWEDFEIDADLVRELNVPKATLSRMLHGKPTEEFIMFLHKEYNLNIHWVYTGQGKPFKKASKSEEIEKDERSTGDLVRKGTMKK
jgi:hypothetical protein